MKTLVLNADWQPLAVISYKRAIILDIESSNINTVEYYDKEIRSPSVSLRIPAVIVCKKYVNRRKKSIPTKRNIRLRDNNLCSYCGIELDNKTFTIDHVKPICRFKNKKEANTWENQVACCRKCNGKKGNKTPKEAGMKLLINPKPLSEKTVILNPPKEWEKYLK